MILVEPPRRVATRLSSSSSLGARQPWIRWFAELTTAGYHGRSAGQKKDRGPYAALVDDPDGNVVLLTSEPQVD